ncbi:hypothetical protein DFH08DRAFT_808166 [Mycena albidolilacea]|uniref:Uncharacterized protein n=1 Tax=Mycena albidolilacea TaxID=1033008 RepID=A0AAD7A2U4_9AGAR|nr:hypothetical protein DFH08DRAFT_808166 [Mycena albidolilacea]
MSGLVHGENQPRWASPLTIVALGGLAHVVNKGMGQANIRWLKLGNSEQRAYRKGDQNTNQKGGQKATQKGNWKANQKGNKKAHQKHGQKANQKCSQNSDRKANRKDDRKDKSPEHGLFESPRNVQNGPEMGPKTLFSSWAGSRGPGTKMDPWANP